MEQVVEVLKLLIIATLAIGYIIKILKGKNADNILGSLVNVIERLGSKDIKKEISMVMAKTETNNAAALNSVVQKVTKGPKKNAIWEVIKFVVPFVL